MRKDKITLTQGERREIVPFPGAGDALQWRWDERFARAVVECAGGCIVLHVPADGSVRPGFYALSAVRPPVPGEATDGVEYMIRVRSVSECADDGRLSPQTSSFLSPAPAFASVDKARTEDRVPPESAPAAVVRLDDIRELPPGNYRIQVLRNGVAVAGAEAELPLDLTVTVGRGEDCGLCLRPHFLSPDRAKRCSRKQLEVFWSEGRLLVRNAGRAPVHLREDGQRRKLGAGELESWLAEAVVELPGDLELALRRVQP